MALYHDEQYFCCAGSSKHSKLDSSQILPIFILFFFLQCGQTALHLHRAIKSWHNGYVARILRKVWQYWDDPYAS